MARQSAIKADMALPHFLRVPLHLPGTAGSVTFCLASYGSHKPCNPKGRGFRVDSHRPARQAQKRAHKGSFRPPFYWEDQAVDILIQNGAAEAEPFQQSFFGGIAGYIPRPIPATD
jgi:hypothetical protein